MLGSLELLKTTSRHDILANSTACHKNAFVKAVSIARTLGIVPIATHTTAMRAGISKALTRLERKGRMDCPMR